MGLVNSDSLDEARAYITAMLHKDREEAGALLEELMDSAIDDNQGDDEALEYFLDTIHALAWTGAHLAWKVARYQRCDVMEVIGQLARFEEARRERLARKDPEEPGD